MYIIDSLWPKIPLSVIAMTGMLKSFIDKDAAPCPGLYSSLLPLVSGP